MSEMNMLIHELSRQTGIPAKSIRYYESIGLIPPPCRAANNYRQYATADVERLRFVASARSLGFSLTDVADILAARDHGIAPCERVLVALDRCRLALECRLAEMLALRETLHDLRRQGAGLPLDDVNGKKCVCALINPRQ